MEIDHVATKPGKLNHTQVCSPTDRVNFRTLEESLDLSHLIVNSHRTTPFPLLRFGDSRTPAQ